jgi:bifunctional NMN adenylyltransferase/nudix hydrolase
MAHKYDMAVFIGRFQPFHLGHRAVIEQGLEQADHVVVLVGSARSPRCHRNPFSFAERKEMILGAFSGEVRDRVIVLPLEDAAYNDAQWVLNVQKQVEQGAWYAGLAGATLGTISEKVRVALIGHSKDATSYYLKLFPQWDNIEVSNFRDLNGTLIRSTFFSNIGHMWVKDADGHRAGDLPRDATITGNVREFLEGFIDTPEYKLIRDENEFIRKYRASWASAPYAPTFVTVDAIVVQSGHVLLVRRGANPGKGLWAMPGGFINADERIRNAVIRELREETGIKVPDAVLRGSIVEQDVFDDPNRSARGRTITHAFLIKLRDETALPKVKGMDDADKARWVPISQLKPEDFFEDHYHIVMSMLARI